MGERGNQNLQSVIYNHTMLSASVAVGCKYWKFDLESALCALLRYLNVAYDPIN